MCSKAVFWNTAGPLGTAQGKPLLFFSDRLSSKSLKLTVASYLLA